MPGACRQGKVSTTRANILLGADTYRMVREQGNKTLELYLQRVRKYSQTLPDTLLPPPEIAAAGAPRMSTPSNDNTWAGWAFSSFTNKFSAASGEMQTAGNGVVSPPLSRPTSVPPGSDTARPSKLSHTRLAPPTTHSSPSVPRISTSTFASSQPEEEDFGDDWGAMDEEEGEDARRIL